MEAVLRCHARYWTTGRQVRPWGRSCGDHHGREAAAAGAGDGSAADGRHLMPAAQASDGQQIRPVQVAECGQPSGTAFIPLRCWRLLVQPGQARQVCSPSARTAGLCTEASISVVTYPYQAGPSTRPARDPSKFARCRPCRRALVSSRAAAYSARSVAGGPYTSGPPAGPDEMIWLVTDDGTQAGLPGTWYRQDLPAAGCPGQGHGEQAMVRGVHHFGLTVRDVDASAAWYGEVLRFRRADRSMDITRMHNIDGGWIRLRTGAGNGRAFLDLANSGPFVPDVRIPSLFEPFQRGEDRARGRKGVGLGLSIARSVVDAHSASVVATSFPRGEV
jgi:Histidine kinase-, DNA gyrase B-, and HSP90-like ATPase